MAISRVLTLLVPLVVLVGAGCAPAQDEVAPEPTVTHGGHWHADSRQGSFRVVAESVGFEHVSCRMWIEWLPAAADGESSNASVARVLLEELSDGFWTCGNVQLTGSVLRIDSHHVYSLEPRRFTVALGEPGSYRLQSAAPL